MKKIILAITVLLPLFLTGCSTEEIVTIKYNTDGGTDINDQEYILQSEFILPSDPELEYTEFVAWYYDDSFETLFSVKDVISRDLTLYAKYDSITKTVKYQDDDGVEILFTNSAMGNQYFPPTDPVKEGYEFIGWFHDTDCLTEVLDTDLVLENTIITACYSIESYDIKIYSLTDTLLHEINITISSDLPLILRELGYNRLFTDNLATDRFDFNTVVLNNTDLYYDENSTVIIGTNMYTFDDNFMNGVLRPAMEAYAFSVDVELQIFNSDFSQAKLNDQVDIMIEEGVDVLLINLVDPGAASTIIDKAAAANIPLVFYMKEPTGVEGNDYDQVWYVGQDLADGGIKQGEMMLADWLANTDWDKNNDGVLDYVLFKGEPGHPYAEARTFESVKVFTDAGITVNELGLQASPTWSTADANDAMTAWLETYWADNIEMIFCNNDGMAFGVIQAMQAKGVDIPIYGIDGLSEALNKISNGDMNGTVIYNADGIAQGVIEVAVNVAFGNSPTASTDLIVNDNYDIPTIFIEHVIVTIDNVTEYQ